MNDRKNIAVIIAQPEEFYQSRLMQGITKQAFARGYDCLVFSTEFKENVAEQVLRGAANIFKLMNFELIDGIIIVPDTIKDKNALNSVCKRIKENFNGPVITLDMEIDGFDSLHSDDGAVIEALCTHMAEVHGCKRIDFMRGIPDHPHSIRREEGYRRAMKKLGLEVEEYRLHDGDFWYDMGEKTADEILAQCENMAQAVVCASDTMAISLTDALIKRGIAVPGQIAVCGYDSLEDGREHDPSIASAEIPAFLLGENAVTLIDARLNNIPYVPMTEDVQIIPAQSCGCGGKAAVSKHISALPYNDNNYRSPFYSTSNDMMSRLISADNIDTLIYDINWLSYQMMPFTAFMLMLCDDSLGTGSFYRTDGYPDVMHMRLIRREDLNEAHINDIRFGAREMLPAGYLPDRPAVYYFTALHFIDRCFGYAVMCFDGETKTPPVDYRDWLRCVCNGMECLRRSLHIMAMYERVKLSAETDALTGLLNRNAFNSYVEKFGDGKTHDAMIMMADLNFLKLINDTYGHLAGDSALKTVAKAIKSVCKNEKAFRFGGDEFMIIGEGIYDDRRIADIIDGINDFLRRHSDSSDEPFRVMASFGAVSAKIDGTTKIDGLIRAADTVMYKNKQASRAINHDPFKKKQ